MRSYTNSLSNSSSEKLTLAIVLDKYLNKVEKALKIVISINLISFMSLISGDLLYIYYQNSYNKSLINKTVEKGTRLDVKIEEDKLISRPVIIEHLKKILSPCKNQSFYYVIYGEYGTGKLF